MKYEIWNKGRVIAKFVNEGDRDLCQDALKEEFQDNSFEVKENSLEDRYIKEEKYV